MATPLKTDMAFEGFAKFRGILLYNMPIMPALCSKLAYYAIIMLDALACLLCLKLCRHNRRRPSCVITSDSLNKFKNNLDKYWSEIGYDISKGHLLINIQLFFD